MNSEALLQSLLPKLYLTPNELDAGIADETVDGAPFKINVTEVSDCEIRIQIVWENYIERLINSFSEDEKLFEKDYHRQTCVIAGEQVSRLGEDCATHLPYDQVLQKIARIAGYKQNLIDRILQVFNQRLAIDTVRFLGPERFITIMPDIKGPIKLYSLFGVRISDEFSGKLYDQAISELSDWSYHCKVDLNVSTGAAEHRINLIRS